MTTKASSPAEAWAGAALVVALALALALALQALPPTPAPLFVAAVAAAAWYGGLGPGLLAAALSTLALHYASRPPTPPPIPGPADAIALGAFAAAAVLVCSLRAARGRSAAAVGRPPVQAGGADGGVEDRRKDRFLALLAHELRSPLATIRGTLHALRHPGQDAATVAWCQGVLDRQVEHLSRLLDDLLDVCRIAHGTIRVRPERLDLAGLLRTIAEEHRPLLARAGLTLAADLPPDPVWVRADPTRLTQVVSNLLANAGKFTDPGGRVSLRLGRAEGSEWAQVVVQDTGAGIDPHMLPRVFDLFSQGENTRGRSRGGLGVGLAIVKGLVELHGGRVEAASEGPGRGATFTALLPCAEPQRPGKRGGGQGRGDRRQTQPLGQGPFLQGLDQFAGR